MASVLWVSISVNQRNRRALRDLLILFPSQIHTSHCSKAIRQSPQISSTDFESLRDGDLRKKTRPPIERAQIHPYHSGRIPSHVSPQAVVHVTPQLTLKQTLLFQFMALLTASVCSHTHIQSCFMGGVGPPGRNGSVQLLLRHQQGWPPAFYGEQCCVY